MVIVMRFMAIVIVITLLLFPVFTGCISEIGDNNEAGVLLTLLENESSNNIVDVSNESDFKYCNVSDEEMSSVIVKMNNFSGNLEECFQKYGYEDFTLLLAGRIAELPKFEEVSNNTKFLSEYNSKVSNITVHLHIYKNLAEGVKKDFNLDLPYLNDYEIRKINSGIKSDTVSDAVTVITLINDYNNLIDAARNVKKGDEKSYVLFYIALGIVVIEIILMKENVAYKVSYKLVGVLIGKTGLYKIIYNYGGSTALKTIGSYMHWETRVGINSMPSNIYNNSDELANISTNVISTFVDI